MRSRRRRRLRGLIGRPQHENGIGIGGGRLRAADSLTLDRILRRTEAGGVLQDHPHPRNLELRLDDIPGRSWMGRDDRLFGADEEIEKGRLPRVRRPENDDPHAVPDSSPGCRGGEERRGPLETAIATSL